jgi:hypothetical protein
MELTVLETVFFANVALCRSSSIFFGSLFITIVFISGLYDIPQEKITKIATFQFSDYAAIWYATLSPEITNDLSKFKAAFFKRFTEDDHILDLSILQTAQGPNESVHELRPIPLKFIKFNG